MTRHLSDKERAKRSPLAVKLVAARDAVGLDQAQVAKKAGISVQALRNLETGKSLRPHPATLQRLAKVLKTTPDQLTGAVSSDELAQLRSEMAEVRAMLAELIANAKPE